MEELYLIIVRVNENAHWRMHIEEDAHTYEGAVL